MSRWRSQGGSCSVSMMRRSCCASLWGSSLFRVGEFFGGCGFLFRWGCLGRPWWLHAEGGGLPCGGSLYRSHRPTAHRSGWKVCLLAFWLEVIEAASGLVVARRVDQASRSRGGFCRRRRGWIQGRRSLGCVPGRRCFSVCFISCLSTSVFCGSLKSLAVMELRPTCGWWHLPSGDGRRQRGLEESSCTGTKGLLDFNSFSRDLCAIRQLSSVSFWMYLYADEYVYWFPNL